MSILIDKVRSLPEDQKEIFYRYMGVKSVCEDHIDEKLSYAQQNNIVFTTIKGVVRFLAMDLELIKERFEMYKNAGFVDLIVNNPEYIRYDTNIILERISLCQKVDRPFVTDGKYADFLFDDKQWENIEKALGDEKDVAKTSLNEYSDISPKELSIGDGDEIVANAMANGGNIDFEEREYNLYVESREIVDRVREAIGTTSDSINNIKISPDELISRLIKTNPSLDAKKLAKYCLEYSYGLVDGIDPIIDAIYENIDVRKRGL